jgi:hypothetical protein
MPNQFTAEFLRRSINQCRVKGEIDIGRLADIVDVWVMGHRREAVKMALDDLDWARVATGRDPLDNVQNVRDVQNVGTSE